MPLLEDLLPECVYYPEEKVIRTASRSTDGIGLICRAYRLRRSGGSQTRPRRECPHQKRVLEEGWPLALRSMFTLDVSEENCILKGKRLISEVIRIRGRSRRTPFPRNTSALSAMSMSAATLISTAPAGTIRSRLEMTPFHTMLACNRETSWCGSPSVKTYTRSSSEPLDVSHSRLTRVMRRTICSADGRQCSAYSEAELLDGTKRSG